MQDTSSKDISSKDTSSKDTSSKDTSSKNTSSKDTSSKDTSTRHVGACVCRHHTCLRMHANIMHVVRVYAYIMYVRVYVDVM